MHTHASPMSVHCGHNEGSTPGPNGPRWRRKIESSPRLGLGITNIAHFVE